MLESLTNFIVCGFGRRFVTECLRVCCAGLKRGQRKAIAVRPQAMLEAKDLPRCDLSEFLEDRLAKALERDLTLRAQRKGMPIDQGRLPCPGHQTLAIAPMSPHQERVECRRGAVTQLCRPVSGRFYRSGCCLMLSLKANSSTCFTAFPVSVSRLPSAHCDSD